MLRQKTRIAALREKVKAWAHRAVAAPAPPLDLQVLEERVLYSATPLPIQGLENVDPQGLENVDPAGTIEGDWEQLGQALQASDTNFFPSQNDPTPAPHPLRSAVFVDESLTNLEQLITALQLDHEFDLFMIGRDSEGIAGVHRALASSDSIYTSMHVLTHGGEASLQFGATVVNGDNLGLYQTQFEGWAAHLSADADILFYGCDVAASANGHELLTSISVWTGADIAASDDLTGNAHLGGDWDLEYRVGDVSTNVIVGAYGRSQWGQLLNLSPASGETLVNEGTVNNQATTPNGGGNVAMDNNGNYAVVWQDNRSGDYDIWARVFNSDGSVKVAEFKVHSNQSSSQEWGQVAMSADGKFAVTWSDNRSGTYESYMRLFDATGTALTGDTLISPMSGQQDYHALDFAADGSFVVVFQNAADSDIYFQRYDANGIAQGANTKVNSYTTNIQNVPDVAVADDGKFIVVWESNAQDGSGYGIYAQRFDATGATLGTAFRVNSTTAGNQWLPSVAAASDGSFVVSWESDLQDGAGFGIYAQRYNSAGVAQGGEIQVNTHTAGDQGSSHIDLRRDGNFIVTWRSAAQDGAGWGVYAQQFDAAGNRLGNETLINTTTSGSQTDPSVAYAGNQAVVVWSGEGAGDTSGVFARRFDTNAAPVLNATKTPVLTAQLEDAGPPAGAVGTLVSSLVDFASPVGQVDNVTDADSYAALGIAVTAANNTNGTFWYSVNGGSTWLALGSVSDSSARLLAADASTRIYFQPNANYNGTMASAITFRAWDKTSGQNGLLADTSHNGGSTAFSVEIDTAALTITAVNDAPVLDPNGTMTFTTITEDQTSNSGDTVAAIIASAGGNRITDVDSGALEGIAIYSLSNSNGTWQYNIGSGWTAVGSVSFSQSLLLRDTDSLRFIPNGVIGGSQYISFAAWDQTSGTAGTKADTNLYGGTTAFSVALETAVLTVTNINDAPSGTDKTVTTLENSNYVFASSDFGFSDSDGNSLAAVVISTLPTAGTLYIDADGDGWVDAGETLAASSVVSLADITANRLKFRPTGSQNGIGYASFNFAVRDNGGTANGGQDTDQAPNTLTINVTPTYDISGTVFEDINYGGGAGRDFVTAAAAAPGFDIDAEGVTVELYNASGAYVASTVTDINGVYTFAVVDGTYTVRVVNSTVLSNRAGATSELIGVQTYRTDASNGAAVGVTDHVGGQRPEEIDALANNGSQTFSTLNNAAGRELQSVTTVLVSALDVSGVDFGFNFDTIINTNDAGQGSLRQFILNSNALDNTDLAQAGQTAGAEVSLFMIADGQNHAGLNTGYNNLLTGTLGIDARAIITLASALPTVTAANTVLDASTQTLLVGNSNPGSVGAGGAASMTVGVGLDGIAGTADDQILNAFDRPEVEIRGNGITANLLHVTGASFTFDGFAVWGNGGNATSTLSIVSGAGHLIQHNLFGTDALGVAQAHTVTGQNQFVNLSAGVTGATVFHNYVTAASQAGSTLGIYPNIDSSNVVLDSNEFSGAISWGTALYAHNATATRNYFHNLPSQSLATFYGPFTNQVIEHNTFANNLNGINLQGTGSGAVRYNLIQGNTSAGITLTTANSNVDISKNSIHGNGGVGISVSGAGTNDGALTSGANHGMDFPVLTRANLVSNTLTLAGYVGSAPNQAIFGGARIEFFVASATGSGQTYLGFLTADVNGNFSGSLTVSGLVDTQRITATATLASSGTSQFSAAWGLNGRPTDLTPNSFSINENTDTSSGYAVGTLTTTDPDSGDSFTYTVIGGVDAAKFSISGNQLILTDGVLDFETQPTYSVQIRTTDAQGLWYEETLTIDVNNIDEPPLVIVSSEVDNANNQVVDFQGGDDSISLTGLPVNTASGTEVTVEFWMKWDGTNSVMPFGFESYDLWLNNGYIGFNTANGDLYGVSSSGLETGWHHVAAIFHNGDAASSRLLIDGVEQSLAQQLNTPNNSQAFAGSDAHISGWTVNPSYRFDGQIDQLRIWNGARSETQIRTEMYQELTGPQIGLVAVYSFAGASTGAGGVVDDSGNGHHGTMVGMTSANVMSASGFDQLGDHTVNENEVVRLQVAAFDPENQPLTYSWSQTAGPTVNLSNAAAASPTFTAPNYSASYQLEFSVTVSDGINTTTEHVTISVTSINDAPAAVADVATAVEASGIGNDVAGLDPSGNVLTNDSDADAGDTKTVVGVAAGIQGSSLGSVGLSVSGSYGAIVINADGSYSYTVDNDHAAVEALNQGESLSDTFTYTISDAAGAQATAQIVITIDGRTDQPVATADTATAVESGGVNNGAAGNSPSGNVLDNDVSGNGKTVSGVAAGSTGSAAGNVSEVVGGLYGTIVINSDGSYSYTLDNSNAAVEALRTSSDQLTDVFTYSMKDSFDNVSSTELTITISGQNDDPRITAQSGNSQTAVLAETDATLTASGTLTVTDVDLNDPVSAVVKGVVSSGNTAGLQSDNAALLVMLTATADVLDGSEVTDQLDWSFDSANEYFDYLAAGESLVLVYQLEVTDSSGATASREVTITVNGTNDRPVVAGPATATVGESGSLSFESGGAGLISSFDIDRENLTVTLTADHATLTLAQTLGLTLIDADGSDGTLQFSGTQANINAALDGLVYNSAGGYNGAAVLEVLVNDGQLTDLLTIAITVNPGQSVFIWDGGGASHDWTDPLNWNFDRVPEADDIVVFDATSAKHALIDAGFAGSVAELRVEATFSGNIVQARALTSTGDFSLAGGSFDTAGFSLNVDGGLVHTAGSLAMDDSQVMVGGNFESTSGSLTATGSTLRLDGAGDQSLRVTGNLGSVVVDTGGTCTLGDDLQMDGDLVVNGLSLDAAGFTVILNGGGSQAVDAAGVSLFNLSITGGGSIDIVGGLQLTGDLFVGSAASLAGVLSVQGNVLIQDDSILGDSTIRLNGSGSQMVHSGGTGASMGIANLIIDKASGMAQLVDRWLLSGDLDVLQGSVNAGLLNLELSGTNHSAIDGSIGPIASLTFNGEGYKSIDGVLTVNGLTSFTSLTAFSAGTVRALGDVNAVDNSYNGDGLIVLGGAANQSLASIGAGLLRNLTIDKSGGIASATSNLTIEGSVTHVAGTLALGGTTTTFRGSNLDLDTDGIVWGDVLFDGLATFRLGSDMTIDGNLTLASLTGSNLGNGYGLKVAGNLVSSVSNVIGDFDITFNGSADQTITGEDLTDGTVTIDKLSGSVFLADNLTLNGLNQDVIVRGGVLHLNGMTITTSGGLVVDGGTVAGAGVITNDLILANAGVISLTASSTGNYDQLLVGGTAHITSGSIQIDVTSMSTGGMLEQMLKADSLVGTLNDVTLVNDGVGFSRYLTYNPPSGAIDVFLNTPPAGSLGDIAVDEDAAPTTIDLNAAFEDSQHADGQLTFTIVGNTNTSLFSSTTISDGVLTLSYAADQHGSSNITVRVTDPYGEHTETTFQVMVNSVNDEQVIGVNTGLTVAENSTGNLLTASVLSTIDVDNTSGQLLYTLTASTSHGTLRLSGVALTAGATFTQADIDAGRVSYDHDGSETASDSFGFTVDDGSGSASNGTFAIAISPVNDQIPVITSNGGGATAVVLVNENVTAVTQVTATDGDLPAPTLIYSIEGGADRALFSIDATTGILEFISARDRELAADADGDHIYEVIVQASDGSFFSRQVIEAVIGDVDEYDVTAPVDINPTLNIVNENTTIGTLVGITVFAKDADATTNSVSYSLTNNDGGRFAINASTGEVRLARGVDYEVDGPSRTIRVRAISSDGSWATKDFTIAIGDVNEAPIARPDVYATSYIDDLIVNLPGVAGNDSDPDGDAIAVVLVQGPATGTATLLSNGSLLYRPQPGFLGTVQLVYYVTDGTLNSSHETVTIQVTQPTNVPPPVDSSGKDAGSTPPPKPPTEGPGPVPVKPSPVVADETGAAEVAIAPEVTTVETKQGRTLQPTETTHNKTVETTVIFNPMHASNLLEHDIARMQLSESTRVLVRHTQSNHVVYAQVDEQSEEEIVQDWVSHIDPYVATAVGTGIVIWLVHAGQFAAALLSTASTWVHIDPLTVLQGAQELDVPETCEEKLFDGQDELRSAGRDRQ